MEFKKILKEAIGELNGVKVSPDNLVCAIAKLLEIMHANGLDNEAVAALSDCGIKLEIAEG